MYSPYIKDILVRIEVGGEKQTLSRLKDVYQKFYPKYPFEFTFMDDEYAALYASEQRLEVLSKYFAGLAILISCLGLFGLASFTAERRRKEIGVRKVLGAQVSQIVLLLSKDFLHLVFLAICIGFPIALWATNKWLEGFAYKAHISWWLYALAAMSAVVITLLTVGFQSIGAAVSNPAKSLGSE
jgi:ABC-type antimicrobial peptide transport system permease subunit